MNKARYLLLTLIVSLLTCGIVVAKKPNWADQARMRKADYLYLEGINRDVQESPDAAFDLLGRAFTLNPDDKTIGYHYGQFLLSLANNDSTAIARTITMVSDYYRENPSDFNASARYGFMLEYLNRNDEALAVWEDMHKRFPDNPNVTFKLANTYAQQHDTTAVRKAIALYDLLQETDGESTELEMNKIRLLYMIGDTAAIYTTVNKRLNSPGGRTVEHLIMAGDVYHALEHSDMALSFYKEACEIDSTSGEAFYNLASYYNAIGDSVGFDREVYNALTRSSLDPDVKSELLRGYVMSHIGDSTMHGRITELFNVLVDQHPHESSVRNAYCNYLTFLADYPEAAEQMSYSLAIDPDQDKNWTILINLYILSKDTAAARKAITDAERYFPEDPWLYYYSAQLYGQDDQYDKAVEEIKKGTGLVDDSDLTTLSHFQCFLGDMLYKEGNHDDAFAAYEDALLKDPDNTLAMNNYAYFLALDERDLDHAQAMVENALRQDSENLNAVDTYAWVLFKKKDYQRAREVFDSAIDEMLGDENVSAEAFEHAGDIYFMTGDQEKAVEFWEKALELDPDNELLQRKVVNKTYFFK